MRLRIIRNLEIIESACRLPHIGSDHDLPSGFCFPEDTDRPGDQVVPVIGIVGHGFVHQFIGHETVGVFMEFSRKILPQPDEFILFFRIAPKWSDLAVEIMRPDDVKINHHAKTMTGAPSDGIVKEGKGLFMFLPVFIPHLHLVDRQPDMVVTRACDKLHIFFREEGLPLLASPVALGEPVADIHAAVEDKILACWPGLLAGNKGEQSTIRIGVAIFS